MHMRQMTTPFVKPICHKVHIRSCYGLFIHTCILNVECLVQSSYKYVLHHVNYTLRKLFIIGCEQKEWEYTANDLDRDCV